jgi:hypothetical protein
MTGTPSILDAGEARFPSLSKDLILANKSFEFIVTGAPATALRRFIVDGRGYGANGAFHAPR